MKIEKKWNVTEDPCPNIKIPALLCIKICEALFLDSVPQKEKIILFPSL